MLIDSHCHLNMKDFEGDLENVIKNANDNNIKGMLTISTMVNEFNEVKSISNKYQNPSEQVNVKKSERLKIMKDKEGNL